MDEQESLINLCKEIVRDGVLTKSEIVGLAKWINAHPKVRKNWPGKPLVKLLKNVFADNKISKDESRQVGAALQAILRKWAKREKQVAVESRVTIEIVDAYPVSGERDAPPPGDWQFDPATDRQVSFANSLGLTLPKDATKGKASDLISKALKQKDSKPATSSQLEQAKLVGVSIPRGATVAEAKLLIRAGQPTWQQKQFFERVEIEFPRGKSRTEVEKKIKHLMREPAAAKKVENAIDNERKASVAAELEMRQEDIDRYGQKLVEEFERWEKLADDIGPYVVIFRSGKSLKVDVVEFDGCEIEEKARGKSRVVLDCLFPKRFREDGEKWLEWEKERQLVASKIEFVSLLEDSFPRCSIEEIETYESVVADFERRAEQLAS